MEHDFSSFFIFLTPPSIDGAEIAKLVGIYIISKLSTRFDTAMLGIYRDDGLMVIKGGGPDLDPAREAVISIFKKEGLRVTAECSDQGVQNEKKGSSFGTRPILKYIKYRPRLVRIDID